MWRRPKIKVVKEHNWMRSECKGCPYFVDGTDEGNGSGLTQCVRPFGESCLADNILIQEKLRRAWNKQRG